MASAPVWPASPLLLEKRAGPRPRTTQTNPHSQIDQLPRPLLSHDLIERLAALPGISLGPSGRAPYGTIGLYLSEDDARGPERAFLLPREFAHLHPEPDGSLHLPLPEPVRSRAIAAGWAEPHPLAGQPSVSPDIVMVYAPRDAEEIEIVATLVASAWAYARGAAAH
ncbi:luciferase family protein [Qipengyuania qiaonensis]|uniref:DUF5519 family protein n=1 Tax=Qipengyuania qiaonensis TaxID=2867240 RepID=A0ABS7J760_9SPHN|nr:luciferase family protein [Qipengyuania qiaonensis]MBX7481709.1 DUF5519 family protein [Qipengyuania qiaonensis]